MIVAMGFFQEKFKTKPSWSWWSLNNEIWNVGQLVGSVTSEPTVLVTQPTSWSSKNQKESSVFIGILITHVDKVDFSENVISVDF